MNEIPDPSMKTVRIPVVFKEGVLRMLGGSEMPEFKEGSVGHLEMDEFSIIDTNLVRRLQAESDVEMLPAGEKIYFGVSPNMVPDNLKHRLLLPGELGVISNYWFVEVELNEPLMLHLRGTKTPQLSNCRCVIPSLRNLEATSMNHAFTLISTHYEKRRKSHSGNVFQRGHWRRGGRWFTFDQLRIGCQATQKGSSV